jgi:hypothetical protein
MLSVDVRYLEEVEVWSKDPFGGRGTLEFSNQTGGSPEAAALYCGEKISG